MGISDPLGPRKGTTHCSQPECHRAQPRGAARQEHRLSTGGRPSLPIPQWTCCPGADCGGGGHSGWGPRPRGSVQDTQQSATLDRVLLGERKPFGLSRDMTVLWQGVLYEAGSQIWTQTGLSPSPASHLEPGALLSPKRRPPSPWPEQGERREQKLQAGVRPGL